MKWIAIVVGVAILAAVAVYLGTRSDLRTVSAGGSVTQSAPEPYPINPKPPPPDATTSKKPL